MKNGSAAECVVAYDAPVVEMERKGGEIVPRLKGNPWVRIVVDTLLVAGILLASACFLTVK